MTPDERERALADAVHDLDTAPDGLDAVELADQLQVHGRLTTLYHDRDLSASVVRELRYEDDAPRFAADVVGKLKAHRFRALPRVVSLAAAACFLLITGWMLVRQPATPPERPNALLVVGRLPLGAGDRAAADRLERLGFAVEAATPESFDPRRRALVVVSSTVLAETLRDVSDLLQASLRDLPVPVLVWEPRLYSTLGLTAKGVHGVDWAADPHTALRVDAPGHPLAAGFSGSVTVTRSRDSLSWGRVGPAAIRVASLPGDPDKTALFAYERGTAMDGGSPAPARRVGCFLFDGTAAVLTDDGGRLFDAAVLWCAGKGNE
jgi:hypothetical protein